MITVTSVAGPDPAFLYLKGECEYPQCARTRSISLAALADGSLTVVDEKAALIADVEQAITNWIAAQEAIANL